MFSDLHPARKISVDDDDDDDDDEDPNDEDTTLKVTSVIEEAEFSCINSDMWEGARHDAEARVAVQR